jgi:signal transduction histidine kinase
MTPPTSQPSTRSRAAARASRAALWLAGTSPAALLPSAALAQAAAPVARLATHDVIQLAMFVGAMSAAILSAVWVIRLRIRTSRESDALRLRLSEQTAELERYETLGDLSDQLVLVWTGSDEKPDLLGSLPEAYAAPRNRASALAFQRWLDAESAAAVQARIETLRARGETFSLVARTPAGIAMEVIGRTAGNRAAVRFIAMTERQAGEADLQSRLEVVTVERDRLAGLMDALDHPVWLRDARGDLAWVNTAYARAVGLPDGPSAVAARAELLGSTPRRQIAEAHLMGETYRETVTTVVGHERRRHAVTALRDPDDAGSAAIAVDVSAAEHLQAELARLEKNHAETLDQLATAVAIFDRDARLAFHNAAFQKLWQLDAAFLSARPTHAILLDRLRSDGRLPEGPDWRSFKEKVLGAYRALQTEEDQWHVPGGQVLRVLSTPNPHGGLTQVFENLTQQLSLESENKTLLQVRRETLDHLAEGVAVFGTDGGLKLHNPAFAAMWGLDGAGLREGMRIRAIVAAARPVKGVSPWPHFISAITGAEDKREAATGRVEFADGTVLSHSMAHLPNGQTMLAFVDVTDSVSIERVLKSRNAALEDAALIKNRFVHHMSYELRSPLTTIKGFAEILKLETAGPLNERQRGYVEHILRSSNALEVLVNDVLDLATIDADMMQLVYGDVDVRQTAEEAASMVQARLAEHRISVEFHIAPDAARFEGDAMRVRQILFNLIDNAANYAPEGSVIEVGAQAQGDMVAISVRDRGPGIPNEDLETILARFESRLNGGRRRGAGIGLSVVSGFMRLHGGTVTIDSAPDRGTLVTCTFPRAAAARRSVA